MRRVSLYAVLALFLCAFVSPSQSRADGVDDFTLSDGLGNTITWQLPASPASIFFAVPGVSFFPGDTTAIVTGDAAALLNGSLDVITPVFLNLSRGGGVEVRDVQGILSISSNGISIAPQVYSGNESAPTFLTGTFSFPVQTVFLGQVEGDTTGILTITPDDATAVPEPSTLALLAAGLLGMGAMLLGKLR